MGDVNNNNNDDDDDDDDDDIEVALQMIDEFMDVNSGEKELMKLWNLHVMKEK